MPYNNDDDNDILLKRRSSNRTSNTDRNSHPPRRTTERRPVTNHSSGSGSDSGNHGSRPPVNRRKRKRKKKTWKNILHILLVLALIAAISLAAWVLVLATDLPEVSPETLMPKQTSFVYDQNDEAYADLYSGENRVTVPLDEMPQHLKDVVIATEDIRFYKHFGIDVKRVFGAVKADLISGGFSQGASTITMQLARNAILESQDKKLNRKIKESILSIQIERQYSKDEILYFYLNEVYLGMRATYGVEAASHLYFDKDVQDISLGESALLAGLLRNPGMYSPFENIEKATHIRNVALDNLIRYKPEYKEAAEAAKQETLIVCEDPKGPNINYNHPWFTDYVVDEAGEIMEELSLDKAILYTGGLHIYTTLDANTQDRMEEIYEDNDYFPSSRTKDIVESSMLVMDNDTGEIKGLVGGREYTARRGFNRATDLARQPGSSIKPISVYAPALEAGYSPASVMNDCPTTFGSNYKPTNYDGRWRGLVSMRTAITYSANVPAVKFLQTIGPEKGLAFAQKAGLPLDDQADNNLALALGGISHGVSPLDMAGAYGAFANKGIYNKPHCIRKIVDSKGNILYQAKSEPQAIMSEQSAYLLTDMLVSVTTTGTGSNARMNRPVASKTGTVQLPDKPQFENIRGNKDAWFAAYTPELVGIVWMGYDKEQDADGNYQYLRQIYGGKYPARIWKNVMTTALKDVPVTDFPKPEDIISVSIDSKSGLLPSSLTPGRYIKTELFAKNNVPTKHSDVWKIVEIDPSTNLLANKYCPERTKRAMLIPPESSGDYRNSEDGRLYAPSRTCNVHDPNNSQPVGQIGVIICTDERHEDNKFLANIPQDNSSGGCPESLRQLQYFNEDQVPKEHCSLKDHAINENIVIGPEDEGKDTGKDEKPDKNNPTTLNAPSSLKFSTKGSSCNLSWKSSNPSSTTYVIERITNSDQDTKVKFSTNSLSYTDSGLEKGSSYRYRVYAYNAENDIISQWSKSVTVAP